jgi:hypothetical protein
MERRVEHGKAKLGLAKACLTTKSFTTTESFKSCNYGQLNNNCGNESCLLLVLLICKMCESVVEHSVFSPCSLHSHCWALWCSTCASHVLSTTLVDRLCLYACIPGDLEVQCPTCALDRVPMILMLSASGFASLRNHNTSYVRKAMGADAMDC